MHFRGSLSFAAPAAIVFAWLPLLVLGILAVRSIGSMGFAVTNVQGLLKDGKEHPLQAAGFVAAFVVFLVSVSWQLI